MKKDNSTSSTNSTTLDSQKSTSTPRNVTSTTTTNGDNSITPTTIVSNSNTTSNNLYSSPLNQSFTDLLVNEEDANVSASPKDSNGRRSVCGTPPMNAIPKIIESPSPTSSRYSIKSRLSIDNSHTF